MESAFLPSDFTRLVASSVASGEDRATCGEEVSRLDASDGSQKRMLSEIEAQSPLGNSSLLLQMFLERQLAARTTEVDHVSLVF